MKKQLKTRAVAVAIGVAGLLHAATAQAALQDRDLDGDSVTDAFYDTALDITWLRDANVNGARNWPDAKDWAAAFTFAGHSDWRLPTNGGCFGSPGCLANEMSHLYWVDGVGSQSPGAFQNLQASFYWTADEFDASNAWAFGMDGQQDSFGPKLARSFPAMAVADGDIALVPEPGTLALWLAGLVGVGAAAARRRHLGERARSWPQPSSMGEGRLHPARAAP